MWLTRLVTALNFKMTVNEIRWRSFYLQPASIETDIECALLSFLSEKFVSTKWRISKGILAYSFMLRVTEDVLPMKLGLVSKNGTFVIVTVIEKITASWLVPISCSK